MRESKFKRAVRSTITLGSRWQMLKDQRDFLCGFDAYTFVHYGGSNRWRMELFIKASPSYVWYCPSLENKQYKHLKYCSVSHRYLELSYIIAVIVEE